VTRKENLIRTIRRDAPRWVPYRYDGCLTSLKPPVVVRPVEGGLDDWGVNWIPTNEVEGSFHDGRPVITIDDAATYRAPETDFDRVTEDLRRQLESHADEDTLIIAYDELPLFDRAQMLLGTEELLVACLSDAERLGALLDTIIAYQEQLAASIMASGVSGVRFTDDWGMQRSLFISPESWRDLIKPRIARLYRIVKDAGGFVFQHSCGHIEEIVPDLIEIGVDVLDPCQPAANDVFAWKARYGDRLSFMGALDTQTYLSMGTPEEVRGRVREVVEHMSAAGGYIAAPSHTIRIPEANRLAMVEAIEEVNARRADHPRR
jgi:uroporphyrinogen decarboxylase